MCSKPVICMVLEIQEGGQLKWFLEFMWFYTHGQAWHCCLSDKINFLNLSLEYWQDIKFQLSYADK